MLDNTLYTKDIKGEKKKRINRGRGGEEGRGKRWGGGREDK
jgi:hypothetical protein